MFARKLQFCNSLLRLKTPYIPVKLNFCTEPRCRTNCGRHEYFVPRLSNSFHGTPIEFLNKSEIKRLFLQIFAALWCYSPAFFFRCVYLRVRAVGQDIYYCYLHFYTRRLFSGAALVFLLSRFIFYLPPLSFSSKIKILWLLFVLGIPNAGN